MKDQEVTQGKEPILDSRGLMCDVQQLRAVTHTLACNLDAVLRAFPGLEMFLGEQYEQLHDYCAQVHAVTCDKEKPELPLEEDPTWRLFHQTND